MKETKNTPYVKAHVKGLLVNPITKENPYLNKFPTTSRIKKMSSNKHPKNNKAGVRMLITYQGKGIFYKTVVERQFIKGSGKAIYHYNLK